MPRIKKDEQDIIDTVLHNEGCDKGISPIITDWMVLAIRETIRIGKSRYKDMYDEGNPEVNCRECRQYDSRRRRCFQFGITRRLTVCRCSKFQYKIQKEKTV